LRGLSGVYVFVEPGDDDAKRAGLDDQTIRTDVELKLRLAGIKVLTLEEEVVSPGYPSLYIDLNLLSQVGFSVYSVRVELQQKVLLWRDKSVELIGVPTWSSSGLGIAGQDVASKIRGAIRDLVDSFVNAYLSVNPKK
jgi:hypothetical protein